MVSNNRKFPRPNRLIAAGLSLSLLFVLALFSTWGGTSVSGTEIQGPAEMPEAAEAFGAAVVVNPGNGQYGTLDAAFNAINAGTHTGDIVVSITSNTTEPGTAVLNSSGAGSASYTSILIQPVTDNVTISGASVQGRGLIELNGADNVTINGDNPNTAGTNRDLTIHNTAENTTNFTSVIRIALNTTTVNSADNNSFRNLNIIGSSTGANIPTATGTTGPQNTTFGIFAGPNASTDVTAPTAITSVTTGVAAGATATNLKIENNSYATAARAVSINGAAATVFTGLEVRDNHIGNPVGGVEDQVTAIGITVNGATGAIISGNTVYVEGYIASSTAGHGINVGVNSTNTLGAVIEKNRVNRVVNSNGASWSAFGINIAGVAGSAHTVQNNFVSGVLNSQVTGTGAFGTTFGAYGIRIASGTGHKIYHNSVHLYGAMPGTTSTNLTVAFVMTATGQTGVDVRNNVFSNQISGGNPAGTRNTVIYLPPSATSAMNLTINNNGLYAGTDDLNTLAQVGATFATSVNYQVSDFDPASTTPETNFRAYTSTLSGAGTNDNASFAIPGAPPFVSNTDLHIPNSTATPLESRGVPVGVLDDIDGDIRSLTTPDIGADEFDGTFVDDFLPPSMNYTPFGNTLTTTNRVLDVEITDESGVPIVGALVPRIYFSKNGGTWFSTACSLIGGTGTSGDWDCTIDNALMGGVVIGDSVSYFTIAQDTATPMNIGSKPGGVTATDVNTVTEPPPSPNSYLIVGTLPTTILVGDGGTFASLTNAGGLFDTLNTGFTLIGDTTILITSNLTSETGVVGLSEFAEDGPGGYRLTIRPSGGPRTISGTSGTNSALINFNGVDRVTFDGSLIEGGTDRSLTIVNNQATSTAVFWIKGLPGNGSTGNEIKNCILHGAPGPNSTTTAGILSGSGTTLGSPAEAANSNNRIENNWIYRVQNSMFLVGGTAANIDENWVITNNDLGSSVFDDNNIFRGMLLGHAQNFVIANNTVQGIRSTATTTAAMNGIQLAFLVDTGVVANNTITNIKNISGSGTGAFGISVTATSLNSNVAIINNTITDVAANGSATLASNGYGIIFNANTSGYGVYYNSINMNTNQGSGTTSAMFVAASVVGAGGLDVRNNIFANTQTAGATRYSFYSAAGVGVYAMINHNNYFTSQNVGFLGGARVTLADWQTATGQDANSLAVDPLFVSPTDLHISAGSPMIGAAVPIVGITTDIDGDLRHPATPDIGADEFTSTEPGPPATISGIVNQPNMAAISGAMVTLSVGNGVGGAVLHTTYTNSFGRYSFPAVPTNVTYTVTVSHPKRFDFAIPSIVIHLQGDVSHANFIGTERE